MLDIQFGNYTPQGVLNWPNEDIHCGGAKEVCIVPSWTLGRDYANFETGKVCNTAPLKDTITVPSGGYVVVYFKSTIIS